MQRILSVETSRNGVLASEFVTKRLCCSFILTVAFLTLLGGYLLGQFTSDRACSKTRDRYHDLNRKIEIMSALMKNITFQNKCNFSMAIQDSIVESNNIFLAEVIECFKNR